MELNEIGELIRTQDNLCTSDPVFIVQQKKRIYGLDSDYCDDYEWIDKEGSVADAAEIAEIQAIHESGDVAWGWTKTYYIDTWEFVTACFTRKGCEDYISANGHNLKEPRIYVASAYRNQEFIKVREYLKELE